MGSKDTFSAKVETKSMGTPFTKTANTSGTANPHSRSTSRAVTPEGNDLASPPDTETSMVPRPIFDDSVERDMMPKTKTFLADKWSLKNSKNGRRGRY